MPEPRLTPEGENSIFDAKACARTARQVMLDVPEGDRPAWFGQVYDFLARAETQLQSVTDRLVRIDTE